MVDDHLRHADQRLPGHDVQHRRAGAQHQEDRHARRQQAEEQHQEQHGPHGSAVCQRGEIGRQLVRRNMAQRSSSPDRTEHR